MRGFARDGISMQHASASSEAVLSGALMYVRRGWAVTPLHGIRDGMCTCHKSLQCKSAGKHPVWNEWPDIPVTGEAEALQTFGVRFPYANVGILTGPASGLWVLDVDPKNGGDVELDRLVAEMGALPYTYAVKTGSGGQHLYFAMPDDFVPGGSPGRLPAGLDVRGLGGQVVAPPSVSGVGPYSVLHDSALIAAPGWLLDLIRPLPVRAPSASVVVGGSASGVSSAGAFEPDATAPPSTNGADPGRGRRYAVKAINDELDKLRLELPGHRGGTAVRAAYALIELINSPWADLGALAGQVRDAYDEAARAAMAAGGDFDEREADSCWKSAARKVGSRGRPEPPEIDYGGGELALVPWSQVPGPFDVLADAAKIMSGDVGNPTVADPTPADAGFERDVRIEAHRQRVRVAAREIVDAEQHAAGWHTPDSFGPLCDELMLPEPMVSWRIRSLLGLGHNALVVAKRKTGKTTLINELVRSLADGEKFLGRFEVIPADGAIAIFNYEVEPSQYRRWLREVGIVNSDKIHVLHLRGQSLPLSHPRVRAWTAAWLREREVKIWIPDPYSRAYVGSVNNGNDEAEVGRFLDLLDQVKTEAGVSELIMPTHSGKGRVEAGEESAIGSQRLEGWPDSMWYLTRDETSGHRFLRAEGRDVDIVEEQLHHDAETRRLTMGGWDRKEARRLRELDALHLLVIGQPGASLNELAEGLRWDKGHVRRVVDSAVASRRIYVENGPNRTQKHYAEPTAKRPIPGEPGEPD